MALVKKNPPAKQEIWVRSLGGEDPLEEGMATCSIILAWRIPWTEEPGRLQFIGLQRVEHNWTNLVSTHIGKYQREETCLVNTGSLHGESHSRFVHYRRFAVVVVVQLLSCVQLCDSVNCSTPGRLLCPSLSPGVSSNSCPLSG